MTSDLDLLRRFARENSQDAFTEIVRRHVNLIYSAALRQVRSPQLAEEIAQSVFADLARDAGKLNSETILTAWLYSVARRTAIDAIRKESRRQLREQIAAEMQTMNATENNWTQIEPLLDDAMAALDETDRSAILLRYFENKNLREVGENLKISDDAAQKRVSRAVEKLRDFFSKQKITVGASGLVVLISANAVQSAPIGLAATISAAVFTGTAIVTSTAIATTKIIAMTTLQKTFAVVALTAAIGTGIFEAQENSKLREQNQNFQQQQNSLNDQLAQLQRERDGATNQITGLLAESAQLKSNSNENELLKLRGEVTQLKNSTNDSTANEIKKVAEKVKMLKQLLEQMPDKKIPELQFLTEKDWIDTAWEADLDTNDGIRKAFSDLRQRAENIFLDLMTQAAINKYLRANNNVLPSELSELKPYYDTPVTDTMLQRYQLLQTGKPNESANLVKLAVYADEDYDSDHAISLHGANGSSFNKVYSAIYDATKTFTLANNGQTPSDSSQIAPYLKKPIDDAAMQKYFGKITANIAADSTLPANNSISK